MDTPSDRLAAIIDDFERALNTLLSVLKHIDGSALSPDLRVAMQNSAIVSLTSIAEEAIRNLFQEYLRVLEETHLDFRWLRAELQRSNLKAALKELKKLDVPREAGLAASAAQNLKICFDGSRGYALSKEVLTYNQGNFRFDQITASAKECGINDVLKEVCDCPFVEGYMDEAKLEVRKQRLVAKWNETLQERDTVVHRLSQASGWGASRIIESVELIWVVLVRLADVLASDAQELVTQCELRQKSSSAS